MKNEPRISHIGLDGHRDFSVVTARGADNEIVFRERLEHGDRRQLRRELARWPKHTPVVLEASFGWGWWADELQQAGHDPHLANCRKIAAWREARGMAKSNRIDANLLSELWPQRPRWWEVWLAPPEVRDQREWLRYRMALVQMQTMTKNRIHATLHRHGIVHGFSDLFGKQGREFLKALVDADEPLRDAARQTLRGSLRLLEQLRRQIAEVTRTLRRLVSRDPDAELWRSLPGIGWVLAYTLQAEIGDLDRFRDGRHLASYSLLAPMAYDSGEEDQEAPLGRHVGHAGRRSLKWAFIEAAHAAVRRSPWFRAVFDARTNSGKKDRNRGYIAVAHQLCLVGFACVRKGTRFTEDRPPRPGSRGAMKQKCSANSDPGTGQPEDPMAAAVPARLRASL